MNTTDFLTIASAIVPDRPAIIFEGGKFTFGQLNERSNRLAHAIAELGVKKGDTVVIQGTAEIGDLDTLVINASGLFIKPAK